MSRSSNTRRWRDGAAAQAATVLLLGLISLCWIARPSVAGAEAQASATPEQQAAAHFDRGVELYGEGSLEAALVEFERAYELQPHYRLLYNLAQIQAERHQYAAALRLFEQYLAEGGAEVAEQRRSETLAELAKLRERVALLWVEANAEGAKLYVDDQMVATLPLSQHVMINPGVCRVRVEKPGYVPVKREVRVASGEHPRLKVQLREEARSGAMQRSTATAPRGSAQANYRPFWGASVSALALGGTALTFGLLARAEDAQLERMLENFEPREESLAARRSRLKTYAALTDGFAAASLAALGLALYFLIDPPAASATRQDTARTSSVRVLPRRGGLGLHGTF